MAKRLQVIDDLSRRDHYYLTETDTCIYYGDYTAREHASYSETNQLVRNFKKSMSRRGMLDWHYKLEAIDQVAKIFSAGLVPEFLKACTLVPMPPSKVKGDPEYDDRMLQVALKMGKGLDVRELLTMKKSVAASHSRTDRPSPDELYDLMLFDSSLIQPAPTTILLLDDVITAGSHFVAAKRLLMETFQNVPIYGIFIARRVFSNDADDFSII